MNLTLKARLEARLASFPISNKTAVLDAVYDEAKKDIDLLWSVLDTTTTAFGKYPPIDDMQEKYDAANLVRQQYQPQQ